MIEQKSGLSEVAEKYGWDMKVTRVMVNKTQYILKLTRPDAIKFLLGTSPSPETICDGCNVREPYEHRCHRGRSVVHGEQTGRKCQCVECFIMRDLM